MVKSITPPAHMQTILQPARRVCSPAHRPAHHHQPTATVHRAPAARRVCARLSSKARRARDRVRAHRVRAHRVSVTCPPCLAKHKGMWRRTGSENTLVRGGVDKDMWRRTGRGESTLVKGGVDMWRRTGRGATHEAVLGSASQ